MRSLPDRTLLCNAALLSPSSVGVLNLKFFLHGFPELRPRMLWPSSQVYLWYLCEVGHGRIPAFVLIPTWALNLVEFWFPHSPPLMPPTCAAGDWLALLASSSTTPGLYVALTEPWSWAPGSSLGEGCLGIPHVLLGPPWTLTWWRSRTDPYPSPSLPGGWDGHSHVLGCLVDRTMGSFNRSKSLQPKLPCPLSRPLGCW